MEILIPTTFGGEIADARKLYKSGRVAALDGRDALAALAPARTRPGIRTLRPRRERWSAWAAKTRFGSGIPGGGIYLQPHGLPFAPAWLSILNSGVLMVTAGTSEELGSVKFCTMRVTGRSPGLLQLDHLGGATGRPRGPIRPGRVVGGDHRCGVAINEAFG